MHFMVFYSIFFVILFIYVNTNPIAVELENSLNQGMYVVKARVGTPGITLRLHFDTGSSLTIIPSMTCSSCLANKQTLFNSNSSSTYEKIECSSALCDSRSCNSRCKYQSQCVSKKCCDGSDSSYCGYYVQYADKSSTEGGLSLDRIALVGEKEETASIQSEFGLIFKEQGNWGSFADGLIGSSYGFNYGNPTVTPTWFDSYIKSNTSIPNSYSVCFGREKGILSVGGIDMSLTESDIYYADIQDSYFYAIRLNDIRLTNKTILSKAYTAIFDSGTTLSYLPSSAFKALRSTFLRDFANLPLMNGKVIDGEYALTTDPSSTWPSIELYFDGFYLSIPPSVYFLKYKERNKSVWIFGLASSSQSYFLFGDTVMGAFDIIHNNELGVLGFAVPSAKCSYTGRGSINHSSYKAPADVSTILFIIGLICLIVIIICLTICICVIAKRESQLKEKNQRKQLPITDGDYNVNSQPVMKGKTAQVSIQGHVPAGTAIEMTSQTSEESSTQPK